MCEPHRELISAALEQGRNATASWQELVDRHGFTGRYGSVKRFARGLRGSAVSLGHPTIVTAPGESFHATNHLAPSHPDSGANCLLED